jgi:hypothetical protein
MLPSQRGRPGDVAARVDPRGVTDHPRPGDADARRHLLIDRKKGAELLGDTCLGEGPFRY